jgi:uncharacterized protein YcbX
MALAHIAHILRYPVKSMTGEFVHEVMLDGTMEGDKTTGYSTRTQDTSCQTRRFPPCCRRQLTNQRGQLRDV